MLMSTHYHLMVETSEGNLVTGMRGCRTPTPGGIIAGIGCGAGFSGSLQGHFERGRLGLLLFYAVPPARRPIWLAAKEGLAMAQCADTAAGRRLFVEHLDGRARDEGIRAEVIEVRRGSAPQSSAVWMVLG